MLRRGWMASLLLFAVVTQAMSAEICPGGLLSAAELATPKGVIAQAQESLAKATDTATPKILFGRPAPERTETVWIEVKYPSSSTTTLCTGTLVGRHWVLSAAHCFKSRAIVRVGFGPQVSHGIPANGVMVDAEGPFFPPRFARNGPIIQPGADMALLNIPEVAICDAYKKPVPVLTLKTFLRSRPDALLAVGYGLTEHGTAGQKLQTVVSPISLTCSKRLGMRAGCRPFLEFVAGGFSPPAMGMSADTCEGDSGGPTFALIGNTRVLVGVTSRGLDRTGFPGGDCGFGGIYGIPGAQSNLLWLRRTVPDLEIVGELP